MQLQAGATRRAPGYGTLALLLVVSACSHGEPLKPEDQGTDQPLSSGTPTQLTYSEWDDRYPAWSSSGGSFFYTFQDVLSSQGDRCIGEMRATGGQVTRSRCPVNDNADDSTDVFVEPTPRDDGTLAWVELHNLAGRVIWDNGRLVLGTMAPTGATRTLVRFPFITAAGHTHYVASHLRWLTPRQLAYIGTDVLVRAPCRDCKPDTLLLPQDVMLLDTDTDAAPVPLASSAGTTSIWPDGQGGFFFTLQGDSRVYRRGVDPGSIVEAHDFGIDGVARDISVVGTTLVAVVGGNTFLLNEPGFGTVQMDNGGPVMTADLTSHQRTVFPSDSIFFRRPVLAPGGRSVVAEGIRNPEPSPNLWLYQVP